MRLMVNCGKAQGTTINVLGPRFLIGRAPECQLRPASELVSRRHAELKVVAGCAMIADLGSAGGVLLNGRKLSGSAPLKDGDRFEIGPLSFTALLDEPKPRRPRPAQKASKSKPRRSTEDEIASWLSDDEEEEIPPVDRTVRSSPEPRAGEARAATAPIVARSPDEIVLEAFDLLQAMSIAPDRRA